MRQIPNWTTFFYLVDKNLLLSGITNTGGNREVACKGYGLVKNGHLSI